MVTELGDIIRHEDGSPKLVEYPNPISIQICLESYAWFENCKEHLKNIEDK